MLLYAVALTILFLDQLSKLIIQRTFTLHQTIPVVQGFFDITYVLNPGAAFGFLAGSGAALRNPFFIGISLLAILLILIYHHKYAKGGIYPTFALAFILGGAAGNLIDRLRLGRVVDFLDFHLYQYHWPAFNLADTAIVIGAALLLLEMLGDWRREYRARREKASKGPKSQA
ncbi:MAG: signal peptidase II [candidate division NC10 bacterium]|nr:signal peptidase II [candidate division NC10 bacterium]